jgi:hypothetical protein
LKTVFWSKAMRNIFLILIFLPVVIFSQHEDKKDVWKPFRHFIGKWDLVCKGKPGQAKGEGEFKFLSNEKYIQLSGKIAFEPNEKNKISSMNEDFGIFSFDSFRKKIIFRHFQAEGFIIQYVIDSISTDEKYFQMNSENIENIPPGFKTRVTYRILDENNFYSVFELGLPGKDYEVYVQNNFSKKQ